MFFLITAFIIISSILNYYISGKSAKEVAQNALKDCWKTIFNGNGYDIDNQKMLTDRGNWRFDSGVDAILRYTEPKNIELFENLKVLSEEECKSRQNIMLGQYIGIVEMEALCLIDMIQKYIIPSLKKSELSDSAITNTHENSLFNALDTLQNALADINSSDDDIIKAKKCRKLRLETMIELRKLCDEVESIVPANEWNLATYKELLFIDLHVK